MRMLVLLDACHSGAATGDGSALTSNADLLRSIIATSNVTVLTFALYLNSADFRHLAPATRADQLRILTSLARSEPWY